MRLLLLALFCALAAADSCINLYCADELLFNGNSWTKKQSIRTAKHADACGVKFSKYARLIEAVSYGVDISDREENSCVDEGAYVVCKCRAPHNCNLNLPKWLSMAEAVHKLAHYNDFAISLPSYDQLIEDCTSKKVYWIMFGVIMGILLLIIIGVSIWYFVFYMPRRRARQAQAVVVGSSSYGPGQPVVYQAGPGYY